MEAERSQKNKNGSISSNTKKILFISLGVRTFISTYWMHLICSNYHTEIPEWHPYDYLKTETMTPRFTIVEKKIKPVIIVY